MAELLIIRGKVKTEPLVYLLYLSLCYKHLQETNGSFSDVHYTLFYHIRAV